MGNSITTEEITNTTYSNYDECLARKLLMDLKEKKLKHNEYVQLSRAFHTIFSYLASKEIEWEELDLQITKSHF